MDGPPLCGCAGAAAGSFGAATPGVVTGGAGAAAGSFGAATLGVVTGGADAAAGAFGAATLGVVTGGAGAALAAAGCSAGAVELCAIAGGRSADIVSSRQSTPRSLRVAGTLYF